MRAAETRFYRRYCPTQITVCEAIGTRCPINKALMVILRVHGIQLPARAAAQAVL